MINPNVENAVDLGLPSSTWWAAHNLGASRPEDPGDYYAWGETASKETFNWRMYAHCDGDVNSCHDLGECISGTENDVAKALWGTDWQIPTLEQWWELAMYSSFEWTAFNGVRGGRFTGPNGNSIFLPAAGFRGGTRLNEHGDYGHYWSGTHRPVPNSTEDEDLAFYFLLGPKCDLAYWSLVANSASRCLGQSVRPVCPQREGSHIGVRNSGTS